MEAKKENGQKVWIYWPDQCKLCKSYFFRSENKPCGRELTQEFINNLHQLEHHAKGVYGTLEFRCDYFTLDEEKYRNDQTYTQTDCGHCQG